MNLSRSGLSIVSESYVDPCRHFLFYLIRSNPQDVTWVEFNKPNHLMKWLPSKVRVLDGYGSFDQGGENVCERLFVCGQQEVPKDRPVIVLNGISRMLQYAGLAQTVDRLLHVRDAVKHLVCTLNGESVDEQDQQLLRDFCDCWIDASHGNVYMEKKKKGGKIIRVHHVVEQWPDADSGKKLVLAKPNDQSVETMVKKKTKAPVSAALEIKHDDVVVPTVGKDNVVLPYVKTAVKGKMIFDVEDMKKIGDSSSEEDDDDDDPDGDLDF